MEHRANLYIGILLISLATLALEILQVRIFSVMLWHHLAYMVITVTLLGFGAAGAYVAVKGTGGEERVRSRAAWSALLASLTTLVGFTAVTRIPLDTYMVSSSLQLSFIFLYYAFLIFPYFFMALTITLLLSHYSSIVHRLYFWNLIGSAIGCLAFLAFLYTLGGEASVLAIAAIAALAAVVLFPKQEKRNLAISVATVVLMLVLIPVAGKIITVRPAPSKALGMFMANTPDLKIESTQWDPVARIDIISSPSFKDLLKYHDAEVKKIFTIDGDAYTFVFDPHRPYPEVKELGKSLYGSAYFLKNKPKVAIIGLGGTTDIMTALHFQSREITGVEINQAMIDAANFVFKDNPYHPYKDPSVTIVHQEGRSFLRRSNETYDIIQMSGVDTWSALSTGAYVLSENYLYTREAFQEYYSHLSDNGILCMIRWIFDPPRECLRLVTVQSNLLKDMGYRMPWNHFVVLKQGLLASVLTKVSPFTKGEIQNLKRLLADKPEISLMYAPGEQGQNPFYRYFGAMKADRGNAFIDLYPFKLDTVTDDRPFFFEFYKWQDMFKSFFGQGGYLAAASPIGYIILVLSLSQAFLFGCLFILLPLWRFKRNGLSLEGSGRVIVFFSALGLGFMFVEVALMQKFVLFLGHPTYSIAVTLFSLLVFSGIGSMIAGKLKIAPKKLILFSIMAVSAIVILYSIILTPFFNTALGQPIVLRMLISILVLAPLGVAMGMPFPTGISFIGTRSQAFVPWAFGINGVASVVASILCIIVALSAGFTTVLYTAVAIYLVGGFLLYTLPETNGRH